MRKTLTKVGTSRGLVMTKDMMGLMGIDENAQLDIQFYGKVMIVTPEGAGERERRMALAMSELFSEHDGLMRRLAE